MKLYKYVPNVSIAISVLLITCSLQAENAAPPSINLDVFSNTVARVVFSRNATTLYQSKDDPGVTALVAAALKDKGYKGDMANFENADQKNTFNQLFSDAKTIANDSTIAPLRTKYSDVMGRNAYHSKAFINYVSVWTGAKIENPYTITVDSTAKTASLAPKGSSTDGYIELKWNNGFVVRDPSDLCKPTEYSFMGGQLINPFADLPDIRTSVGYVFRNKSAPTNTFDTATIVGGSDIYAEGALGFPWWRSEHTGNRQRLQSTLEIAGGVVTDKDHLLIHPSFFTGLGIQSVFTRNSDTNYANGFWCGRVGYAMIDRPLLGSGSTVAVNSQLEPEFKSAWVPSVGWDISYPLFKPVNIQFGGNVYISESPASWNLNIGLAVDLDKWL